jgi:hypothetical protein
MYIHQPTSNITQNNRSDIKIKILTNKNEENNYKNTALKM